MNSRTSARPRHGYAMGWSLDRVGHPSRGCQRGAETLEFIVTFLMFLVVMVFVVNMALFIHDNGLLRLATSYAARDGSLYWWNKRHYTDVLVWGVVDDNSPYIETNYGVALNPAALLGSGVSPYASRAGQYTNKMIYPELSGSFLEQEGSSELLVDGQPIVTNTPLDPNAQISATIGNVPWRLIFLQNWLERAFNRTAVRPSASVSLPAEYRLDGL